MTNLFYIQLITSFFVGGIFIALLSFLAERSSRKIAGIVLSLPSTVVVSFIFIAWANSPKVIGDITAVVIAADLAVLMFAIVYMYLSKIKLKKIYSILLCLTGAIFTWFLISLPFAYIKFDNLLLAIIIYIIGAFITYYFLSIKNTRNEKIKTIKYTNAQKIGRAIFAGSIIALSVFLSKVINPFWGGIFSGFPAAFTSTFVILHWYYGERMLFKIGKTVAAGSFVYTSFIFASHWAFPAFGIILGTLLSYSVSILIFFTIKKLKKV